MNSATFRAALHSFSYVLGASNPLKRWRFSVLAWEVRIHINNNALEGILQKCRLSSQHNIYLPVIPSYSDPGVRLWCGGYWLRLTFLVTLVFSMGLPDIVVFVLWWGVVQNAYLVRIRVIMFSGKRLLLLHTTSRERSQDVNQRNHMDFTLFLNELNELNTHNITRLTT